MELASLNFDFGEIIHYSTGKISPEDGGSYEEEDKDSFEFLDSVIKDDKSEFIPQSKRFFNGEDLEFERFEALKLLNICCSYDSINCACSIINGDVGTVPYINDVDVDSGLSPLHTAAQANAPRCVEMLLKRRARSDIKSKDGRGLVPLELSLSNGSLHVTWNPEGDSIGDLILQLGDKDMTVVKLLAEKTKDLAMVACVYAREGAIVPLTALLIVATEKIREATVVALQDDDDYVVKPKMTIYESVIEEALRSNSSMQSECNRKRMLLLREIELLQLFGAAVFSELVDKQTSTLITIVQAGDEAVLELLLNTNIDVNETDAEGNTVLQCSLKGSSVPHKQQTRIMNLLIAHGARYTQKNKLGLSAVHSAAAIGNLSALEILLAANPDLVNAKTVIKETPLFFAVKNNHLDCVELLLQYGASTEIHNLRKQRPIELTHSQDMRFLLNPTNISCFSKETELAQLHSAVPAKADDKEASFLGTPVPPWLKRFIKWLPRFLRDSSGSFGRAGYPLSSLKADFRANFGMDLDHSSLGFPKLIDFIKSFPKLCHMKLVRRRNSGSATHWVMLPSKCPQLKGRSPEPLIITINDALSPNKPKASLTPDHICSDSFIQQTPVSKTLKPEPEPEPEPEPQPPLAAASYSNYAHVTKTLEPEPEPQPPLAASYSNQAHVTKTLEPELERFLAASYSNQAHVTKTLEPEPERFSATSYSNQAHVTKTLEPVPERFLAASYNHHQLKHPVLETLAKIRNSTSIFFLREFDFYQSYETSLKQGMCFWCNKSMLLWANFPCRHKLWCSSCKQEVTQSVGRESFDEEQHRCVVCDAKVERFILSPPFGFDHHGLPNDTELATSFLQFLNIRNAMNKQQTIAQIHHEI